MNTTQFKYPKKAKLDIIKILISEENRLFKNIEAIDFFDEILDLRLLPTTDPRPEYNDAFKDLQQHYINNPDWSLKYIFLEHPPFKFLDSDDIFTKLLNLIISPKVNSNENDIKFFYHSINPILKLDKLEYKIQSYDDSNLPIYKIAKLDEHDALKNIPNNKITFYISNASNLSMPKESEYFILTPTTNWNDYGLKNGFTLYFYNNDIEQRIGELKIINTYEKSSIEILKKAFSQLPDEFCSLAEDISFYREIRAIFKNGYLSILKALNDVAFFPILEEKFDTLPSFQSSLIRYDKQEQLLRQAKFLIDNYDLDNLYKFNYTYQSGENEVLANFSFSENIPLERVYAIIGKNGVGKTRLISKLPIDIAKQKAMLFSPKLPLFSKIIAVSYSAFDKFEIPDPEAHFNYLYCGLRQKNEKNEITSLSETELNNRFKSSITEIEGRNRLGEWKVICENFFLTQETEKWLEEAPNSIGYTLKMDAVEQSIEQFSSGQKIFIYIMTEILANIRLNSLIIFDEPETHLHPNGISQLINSIHMLAKKFRSFCIIATHSPIVIQGLLSKKVYILRNEDGVMSLSHPTIETFGENLTVLTEEIFGTRDIPSYFKEEIQNLIQERYSYEKIVDTLTSNKDTPLSLNVSILLKSLLKKGE
ncbi:AAA family ATPase [Ignatzschineria indica]|uniref:AbiJ-related protein n=1 Tax=Ignatzschineria indica TaxID=472583 RepID=UPI001E594D8C|nr:AAA family ATPase [Ignatzschineria indica]